MNLTVKYMTQNDCYKAGRKITVRGIFVHSTATPNVMAHEWFDKWNKSGISKCVHAFVDNKEVIQHLPWDFRGWHAGAKEGNNNYIGFEICESKFLDDKEYFEKAWNNAIELTIMLCKKFNLTEKDVIGHYEGFKKGIASNHADPSHWFPRHGKSMDTFREEVRKGLNSIEEPQPTQPQHLYRVRASADDAKSQLQAFHNLDSAIELAKANPNYEVYDETGKIVWGNVVPIKPSTPVKATVKPINKENLEIQKKLNRLHITSDDGKPLKLDGDLGTKSKQAIRKFETICGLAIDEGRWGNECEKAYSQIVSKPSCSINDKPSKIVCRYIQFRVGTKIDGDWGTLSDKAVKNYQKKNSLKVDGCVGSNTWKSLIG